MKRAKRRFMQRALVASCVAAAIFLLLAVALGFVMWRSANADSIQMLTASVNQAADSLRTIFNSSATVLSAAGHIATDPVNVPEEQYLVSNETTYPYLKGVGIADLEGRGKCTLGAPCDFSQDGDNAHKLERIRAGQTIISTMNDNGRDYVIIAIPVAQNDQIVGVAYGKLDGAVLLKQLTDYPGRRHYVVDADMQSILTAGDGTPLEAYSQIENKPTIADNVIQHTSPTGTYRVGSNTVAITALGIDNLMVMTIDDRTMPANRSDVVMTASMMVLICAALFLSLMLIAAIYFRYSKRKLKQSAMELETVTGSIMGGVVRFNCDDGYSIRYLNEGLLSTIGYSIEDMTKKLQNRFVNVVHPDDRAHFKQFVAKLGAPGIQPQMDCRVMRKDGKHSWFLIRGRRIPTKGRVDSCICVLTDITTMKEKEQELNLTMQRYAVVIGQSDSIIFEYSFEDGALYVSEKWHEKFSFSITGVDALKQAVDDGFIHPDDVDKFERMFKRLRTGTSYADCDIRLKSASNYIWCVVKASAIFDENGHPYKTVGKVSDVNRHYKERDLLKKRAEFDPLTGIYNKGACQMLIDSFIKSEAGSTGNALAILDIDNFKCVNDTLGHLVGDSVIMDICSRVRLSLRGGDIFGRIGGDEFVILLKDIGNIDNVKHKAAELCTLFRHSVISDDVQINISGSIGVVMFFGSTQTYKQLLGRADVALYEAKRDGKDRYSIVQDDTEHQL